MLKSASCVRLCLSPRWKTSTSAQLANVTYSTPYVFPALHLRSTSCPQHCSCTGFS